jgi:hypothetical protein
VNTYSKSSKTAIIVGSVIGGLVLILIVTLGAWIYCKKKGNVKKWIGRKNNTIEVSEIKETFV